mgnify:CR=1 FL=1
MVTSGKGGVGKTTTSAAIGTGLALRGHKTVIVDFDVGLRNLDLIMGCERRVVYDFVNVVNDEANLKQALIKDKRFENLFVLAASQTRDKDALTKEGVEKVLKALADVGYESPSPIQAQTIPHLLAGRDVLGVRRRAKYVLIDLAARGDDPAMPVRVTSTTPRALGFSSQNLPSHRPSSKPGRFQGSQPRSSILSGNLI